MEAGKRISLEQIRGFLEASEEVAFEASDRGQVYGWVERTLREQRWSELKRAERGLVRRYLGEDDRTEQGADHPSDRDVLWGRADAAEAVSAASVPEAVYARRY